MTSSLALRQPGELPPIHVDVASDAITIDGVVLVRQGLVFTAHRRRGQPTWCRLVSGSSSVDLVLADDEATVLEHWVDVWAQRAVLGLIPRATVEEGQLTVLLRAPLLPLDVVKAASAPFVGSAQLLANALGLSEVADALGRWAVGGLGQDALQVRGDGLTVQHGKHRRRIAYDDVLGVDVVAWTVCSALVLTLRNGEALTLPIAGKHIARALKAFIVGAKRQAEHGEPDQAALQALAALTADLG